MEYVLLAMQFYIAYIVWKTRTSRPVTASTLPNQQVSPPAALSGHSLVKVWKRTDMGYYKNGWWFKCSCGLVHPGKATGSGSFGSEADALKTFKSHSALYNEFAIEQDNPLETELNKVKADYAEYREKCYCKDANDDLLLMKKEGKWD